MRQGNSNDIIKEKKIARVKYANRQIDKFIKWSIKQKGYLKYRELVEIQNQYGIKVCE
jgi:hypothetical protein